MADTTKLAALRVSAEMDSSGFARGADQIDTAAKKAGAAAKQLGDEVRKTGEGVTQTDNRIRAANDGLERLKRQFIDGYAASANLERAMNAISGAMDRGAISAQKAAEMAGNAIRRYGQFTDVARIAAKGQIDLASAIERANAGLVSQNSMRPGVPGLPSAGMQQFAAQNTLFQLQDIGVTAAMGMNPFMIALQQGTQISATLGPMGAAGAVEALKGAFVGLINPVSLVTVGLVAAGAAAIQYLMPLFNQGDEAAEKLERQRDAIDGIVRRWGEATPAFKAYVDERERLARLENLRQGIEGSQADAWAPVRAQMGGISVNIADIAQMANGSAELAEAQDAWSRLRREVDAQKATADTARSAQKELMDLFNETGIPAVKEQADMFTSLADAISKAGAEAAIFAKEGGSRISFEQMNKLPGANSRGFLLGDADRASELNDELNRRAAEAQEAERRRIEEANRIAGFGMPVPQPRPNSALPMIDSGEITQAERQLELIRQQAGAYSDLVAQIQRKQALDRSQQDEMARLQLEASLLGATTAERNRALAVFQAEQTMRQQGISLLDAEAERRRNLAAATADFRTQLERSQQAYASWQQAGSSAIDSLFASTGSFSDRLKGMADAMLQWVTQMTLINPIKNTVYGEAFSLELGSAQ